MRTHATIRLTPYELGLPTDPTTITTAGKTLDDTLNSSEASTSGLTKPQDAHMRARSPSHKRSTSDRRSSSRSPTRSMQSEQPLVPLQLTPSAELGFTTEIVAQPDPSAKAGDRTSKKYDNKDWKKYLRRSKNEKENDIALSSMFSWKSRNSLARERIVQTKEITQKVEVVQPKESRWSFRRQSEGSKRHSLGQGEGQKRQSVSRTDEEQS